MGSSDDWLSDRRRVDAALEADPVPVTDVLAALALLDGLRTDLDRVEEQLITLAREHRASWQQIADRLGLRSRQAAEQRWLRLRSADHRDAGAGRYRRRQRNIDETAGGLVSSLRAGVIALHTRLARHPGWGEHEPAAGLARRTLSVAAEAPPGALFDLARLAVADLRAVPARVLGPQTAAALARVTTLATRT
jgi:hypothetical protein